ncbi:reverse trancriptase [Vairimorpha necatrix]
MKKTSSSKAPSSHITRKKQTNWIDKLSREELLDLAINGKRLKDCKYKIVVAHGPPRGKHIIRETWAKLMGIEEKNIPIVKDIEGEGRIFLIRDEFCFQAAEALENASENVRVLVAENEVDNYISRNRSALTKIFSDLRQNWRKYVSVDKAIKVIKNGLSDKPTVSHEEFFLSELNFEHLGKDRKVDSKHHNEHNFTNKRYGCKLRFKSHVYIMVKARMLRTSIQKGLCLVKTMANHINEEELRQQLDRVSTGLSDSLIYTRNHRRKDANFKFCVVRRSRKKEISEAMDIPGLEILKEIPTRDRAENKRRCKDKNPE